MELVFLGPSPSVCFKDSYEKEQVVSKGDALHLPTQGLYLLESGDFSVKAGTDLLSVRAQEDGPFLIVLRDKLPEDFRPRILTRGQQASFYIRKGNYETEMLTDLVLYAGEELEVRCKANGWTIKVKAIDQGEDGNEQTLFSPVKGPLRYEDAPQAVPQADSPHKYLICRGPSGAEATPRDGSGYSVSNGYFIKHLVMRSGDMPDAFSHRVEEFRKRSIEIAGLKEALGHHYVGLLDPNGGGRIYREPFVLMVNEELDPNTPNLEKYVKNHRAPQAQKHGDKRSTGIGYEVTWSVLTQIAWVSDILHTKRQSGHGELTPDNILLRPIGKDGQLDVIVCDFAYEPSRKPIDGFFVSDADDEQLKDWRLRDRFALGSLFFYMITGETPRACTRDRLEDWRRKNIEQVVELLDTHKGEISRFLEEVWTLNQDEKSSLLTLVDQPSLYPQRPKTPADLKPTFRPWMYLAGIALLAFIFVDMPAFGFWRNGTPLGYAALNLLMGLAEPLPTVISTETSTSIPVMPTMTLTSTTTWTPTTTHSPTTTCTPTATFTSSPTTAPTMAYTASTTTSETIYPTATPSASVTPSATPTNTGTTTPTQTPTSTSTPRPTATPTPTQTPDLSIKPSGRCSDFARITSPANWETVSEDVEIKGIAQLVGMSKSFSRYELDFRPDAETGMPNWQASTWSSLIANEVDMPWEPHWGSRLGWLRLSRLRNSGPSNGYYAIRLRIVDNSANYNTEDYPDCIIVIRVDTTLR